MTTTANILVVLWNAVNIDDQSLTLRISQDTDLKELLPDVFSRLGIGKLGLRNDEMDLWAFNSTEEVVTLAGLRYDSSDKRLTRLAGLPKKHLLNRHVDPQSDDLLFIARPNILDQNGCEHTNFLHITLQQTNLLQAFPKPT